MVRSQRVGPRVSRRGPLPQRRGLFRREGTRRGGPGRHRGDQSRAAGHRRDRRGDGAARARPAGGRRGARTGGPGHRSGHRRTHADSARGCGAAGGTAGLPRTRLAPGRRGHHLLVVHPRRRARTARPPRRRTGDLPEGSARCRRRRAGGHRPGPVGPQGGRGARRGDRRAHRHRRHRGPHPRLLRAGAGRPHRCGVAGPRGTTRRHPAGAEGGAAVGRGPAVRAALRLRHHCSHLRDPDGGRLLRRDGPGVGAGRGRAMARTGRRFTVRLRPRRHPLHRRAPAAAGA